MQQSGGSSAIPFGRSWACDVQSAMYASWYMHRWQTTQAEDLWLAQRHSLGVLSGPMFLTRSSASKCWQ